MIGRWDPGIADKTVAAQMLKLGNKVDYYVARSVVTAGGDVSSFVEVRITEMLTF
jgi:hypothetical protein